MTERKVFTYKDVEEAKKYIGKAGLFSDAADRVLGESTVHDVLAISREHRFSPFQTQGTESNWQFFSPDPEPVEEWEPFDEYDFIVGTTVKDEGYSGVTGHLIVAQNLDEVQIVNLNGYPIKLSMKDLFIRYVKIDGTPCGKKVIK